MNDFLNLRLSPREMDILFLALANRPWGEVNNLIANIQQQLKEQQHANGTSGSTAPGGNE